MLNHFLPGDADSFVATLDAARTCKGFRAGAVLQHCLLEGRP
jgi:hypothetical protein